MKISPHTAALANLNHWRAGQGAKIKANRPVEVYRACEHQAQLLAPRRDPLILNAEEIAVCQKRALSHARRIKYGPPGKDADEWWAQISDIAHAWGIAITRADFESTTKTQEREAA